MQVHVSNECEGSEIAVIGLDCRFPGAADPPALWELLRRGREAISRFTDDELLAGGVPPPVAHDPSYVPFAGILSDIDAFDASFFGVTAGEAELMDPQHRVLMEVVWRAIEHAGYAGTAQLRRTGLYAGTSANTYLVNEILTSEAMRNPADLRLLLASDKDFAPTRISHKLDLQGPSVAIQTACSTGLVALHEAARALLAGDADMAIAAAASIRVPHRAGVLHQEGSIFSREGRCRAFDREADGCVPGSGVAAVVLKRLEDALADRDSIYAVVLGSAVNNDGKRKVGYAAPSVQGQEEVILRAQGLAGVKPAQVSYVEAHGTATRLGDSIECAALQRVFGTDRRKRPCAIGSIKTNIGHADAAAGLAGFIKVVLALWNKRIPASLHFREPNPEIDFSSGSLAVADRLLPWPVADGPRIAGVSSFGIGGTNAHVIVREAPVRRRSALEPRPLSFPLSAPTADGLARAVEQLAGHLDEHPALRLDDVAYTLQNGRERFSFARTFVASTREELVAALCASDAARPSDPSPSSGDRFADAGRVALPPTPLQRTRYWVQQEKAISRPRTRTPAEEPLDRWFYAPTWVRSVDFSRASTLSDRSGWLVFVRDGVLGARLAERWSDHGAHVVRLDDGGPSDRGAYGEILRDLAARRIRVRRIVHAGAIDERHPGGAPSVDDFERAQRFGFRSVLHLVQALQQERVTAHLDVITSRRFVVTGNEAPTDLAAAAIAGPSLVIGQESSDLSCRTIDIESANETDLDALEAELAETAVGTFALRGGQRWERRVDRASLPTENGHAPGFRQGGTYVITGGFGGVGFELAQHLASRYAPRLALIDRGRGGDIHDVPVADRDWLAVQWRTIADLLRVRLIHDDDVLRAALAELCRDSIIRYWEHIGLVLTPGQTYTVAEIAERMRLTPALRRMLDFMLCVVEEDGFAKRHGDQNTWLRQRLEPEAARACRARIVERDPELVGMVEFLEHCVAHYPEALAGDVPAISVLYPAGGGELMAAAGEVMLRRSTGLVCCRVLATWIANAARNSPRPLRILEFGAGNGLLTREVASLLRGLPNVAYVVTDIGLSLVQELARVARTEGWTNIACQTYDVTRDAMEQGLEPGTFDIVFGLNVVHATPDVEKTLRNLRMLLRANGVLALIESVRRERWVDMVAGLAEGWWAFTDARDGSPLLDLAGWLRTIGSSGYESVEAYPLDDAERRRADCALIMAKAPAVDRRQASVDRLRALGADVLVLHADVSDAPEVGRAFRQIREHFGPIHGVVHCAGEVASALIANLDEKSIAIEFGARVHGALHIIEALRESPPDVLILTSSLNTLFGGEGQAAYIAANAVIDALVDANRDAGYRTIAINWDRWRDTGLANAFQKRYESVTGERIGGGMAPAQAVEAFRRIVASRASQIAISTLPFHGRFAHYLDMRPIAARTDAPPAVPEVAVRSPESPLEARFLEICRSVLGERDLQPEQKLSDVGADSLIALQLQHAIEQQLGVRFHPVPLLTQTVRQLVTACHSPEEFPVTLTLINQDRLKEHAGRAIA